MNASSHHPRRAHDLAYAQLAAAIGIIIPQALTMQRSLKSPGVSDFVGLGVCWILLPIIVTLAWFKWRDSRFTVFGDAFCLSIGALLQSAMIVAWPATTMPSTLFFWMGDALVSLTGGWIQSAIIGVAICLGVHAVAFTKSNRDGGKPYAWTYYALAIGCGTGLGGFGLLLATYYGWTMYLLPSIAVWLAVGIVRFFQMLSPGATSPIKAAASQKTSGQMIPNLVDISSRLSGWAGAILAILPILLFSMNFQRQRYAAGYWFPILLVGGICTICTILFLVLITPLGYYFKTKDDLAPFFAFARRNFGLLVALGLDILIVYQLAAGQPDVNAAFFKSWTFLSMACASVVSCLPALGTALGRLADRASYPAPPGKALGRIYFSGTLLAIIIVVFLLEGTSMIFSWQFGEEETWIVTSITVGLAGLFFGMALGLDLHQLFKKIKEEGKKRMREEKK